jgi:protein gp37
MESFVWNPWHGCRKYSEGCLHCYVYRRDESVGKDASVVAKTASFSDAVKKDRGGNWKWPSGSEIWLCLSSDFFLEEADPWRDEVWDMVRQRPDLFFRIITKRIARFMDCVPEDWGGGWENVSVGCTVENQRRCDERLSLFLSLPIQNRFLVCEPLLERINLGVIPKGTLASVIAGGESGPGARTCEYGWVLDLRRQCVENGVRFHFKQTGANFVKDGKRYAIPRKDQIPQAGKACIDYEPEGGLAE